MRTFGFSTGSIAKGNFQFALRFLYGRVNAVELSALRENELEPLLHAVEAGAVTMSAFDYVSVHAPSCLINYDENEAVRLLHRFVLHGLPVIVHPDIITDVNIWRKLGSFLVLENMDKRKAVGRTATELMPFFKALPEAKFCFDLGHARQVDPTMTFAFELLCTFRQNLCQLHVSEVNSRSTHDPLSKSSIMAFRKLADFIPEDIPVILETPTDRSEIESEISFAQQALPAPSDELCGTHSFAKRGSQRLPVH